jgi:flavin-dependent dehydrogenase
MDSLLKGEVQTLELKKEYDVIVVGAGPAGAASAKALSEAKLDILMVERDKLPRYKMCSGIVFPSSKRFIADHFGEIPDNLLCDPKAVRGVRIYLTGDSPVIENPFSATDSGEEVEAVGLNTWRAQLDYWLCSRTSAQLVDCCRFDGYDRQGREYKVKLRHCGQSVSVNTRYLIGADGTLSRVRHAAFPGFDQRIGLVPNYEEYYFGEIDLEPGWLYVFMDRSITGYFATVFHKDNQIVVVTGVSQKESVKDYFHAFQEYLKKKHGLRIRERTRRHAIVLTDMSATRNYCLGEDNLLLVGEAGGFLRGAEGITSALTSGQAAGCAILESVKSDKTAIGYFLELAAEELNICNTHHETIATVFGYNFFTRT